MSTRWRTGWRVVLETRDINGAPYSNVYTCLPGETAAEAIDHALERLAGATGGERNLAPGWRVVAAWAVVERLVSVFEIEPITETVFRRVQS